MAGEIKDGLSSFCWRNAADLVDAGCWDREEFLGLATLEFPGARKSIRYEQSLSGSRTPELPSPLPRLYVEWFGRQTIEAFQRSATALRINTPSSEYPGFTKLRGFWTGEFLSRFGMDYDTFLGLRILRQLPPSIIVDGKAWFERSDVARWARDRFHLISPASKQSEAG